jgi:hypothetical protein
MAELDPLPDDIQALLARAQEGAPLPPPGADSAVLAKVSATVGAPLAGAGAAASLAWIKPLGALGVAALIGVGVVGALRGDGELRTMQGPVAVVRAIEAAVPVAAEAAASVQRVDAPAVDAPAVDAPAVDALAVDAPVVDAPEVPRVVPSTPPATPSRAIEGALVEAARDALARGDADAAIAKLEEHQKKFGARGQLVEERHALTVVAFSQRGDTERAQSAAKAFFRLYPNSLFSDTVRAAAAAP